MSDLKSSPEEKSPNSVQKRKRSLTVVSKNESFPPGSTVSWSLNDGRPKPAKTARTGYSPPGESKHLVNIPPASTSNEASHVNVASATASAPKALKACRNCRRSKIKCESRDRSKCKRCMDQDLDCVYEIKVPTSASTVPDAQWMSTVERRLDSFGNTLDTILRILKNQAIGSVPENGSRHLEALLDGEPFLDRAALSQTPESPNDTSHCFTSADEQIIESLSKDLFLSSNMPDDSFDQMFDSFESENKQLLEVNDADGGSALDLMSSDFRVNGTLSFADAEELFRFFNEKISPHLFGYPISHVDLPVVWTRSPILVAAICTVAAIHHPTLNRLFQPLRHVLNALAQEGIFRTMSSESEAIDTVIALCVAGFWLPESSMLTSLALRIAKNLDLNMPLDDYEPSPNTDKDKLRLWYLLYILDGQQSLTSNHSPLFDSEDVAVKNSRGYLLSRYNTSNGDVMKCLLTQSLIVNEQQKRSLVDPGSTLLADMRLVSQVEFNQAVNSIFQGRGWNLLKPSNIGIRWQTNIELDKWMVSWACLLTPIDGFMGSWPSKSTLIHYNFAKMHINSRTIRDLQNKVTLGKNNELMQSGNVSQLSIESSDASDAIAVAAAHNVLNLSTTDSDILAALQYVPVHVHMMLYYAALLLLNSVSPTTPFHTCRSTLTLVRSLRSAFMSCISNEQQLLSQIVNSLKIELTSKIKEIQSVNRIENLYDDEPAKKHSTIAGWPGSVSYHSR